MIKPVVHIDSAEVNVAFRNLQELGRNPREALTAVGQVMEDKVRLGFQNSTDPYGRPWKPLKSRTGKPLSDSGLLENSFSYKVEGNSVVVGTNRTYAPVHQYGATIRPKGGDPKDRLRFLVNGRPVFAKEVTIPPREMLPLNGLPSDWEADIVDAVADVVRRNWAS